MSTTSPNINNYYIGKGIVSFKKEGEMTFRDVGNVPEFEFTPDLETLEHFSSRAGVKTKDRTVVISKKGTLRMVMEEFTAANLALALLGDVDTNSAGEEVIEIFATNAVSGQVKFVGTNEVGATFEWLFNKVDFIPSSAVSPLSDEWGQLEVSGEVSAVDGKFGTVTKKAEEGGSSESSS